MTKKKPDPLLKLFMDDAAAKGMSLRKYCKEIGIDYYHLTGFPSPVNEVSFDETKGGDDDQDSVRSEDNR
jgi:hypothetical protein